jgi:hypothetical protein
MTTKNGNKFAKLSIPNAERVLFRQALVRVHAGEYEVEQLGDGQKIIIKKPGYKGDDDFRVDLYNPSDGTMKSLTHDELFADIAQKYQDNPEETKKIIKGLLDVCNGKEPDDVIKEKGIQNGIGMPIERIFKIYKWVWGQEDCNYPGPACKGRWLSMNELTKRYLG